jgi:acetoin utilization deacetylase AcuC-like enzyme
MYLQASRLSSWINPFYRKLAFRPKITTWPRHRSSRCAHAAEIGSAGALRVYFADVYAVELPAGHRFPMAKYELVRRKLEADSSFKGVPFLVSPIAELDDILLVHSKDYVDRFIKGTLSDIEVRRIGFPWSTALVQRTLASVGGTVACMRDVVEGRSRCAAQIAGGTHHAFPDHGEGFCVFNDIAIAARVALRDYAQVRRILVLDLDVHQGNGVAAIFQGDSRVFTCSFHGHGNYPFRKQKSDLDIEFEDNTDDTDYLQILEVWLPRIMAKHDPDLVFYQAGVDALAEDKLGRLALTRAGLRLRNQIVLDYILQESEAGIVICMGGGYADPITKSVDAHADVYLDAHFALARYHEANKRISSIDSNISRL